MDKDIKELYEILKNRIKSLTDGDEMQGVFSAFCPEAYEYFMEQFEFATLLFEYFELFESIENIQEFILGKNGSSKELEFLKKYNKKIYDGIIPGNYEKSYVNPTVSANAFSKYAGKEFGCFLSAAAAELRAGIAAAPSGDASQLTIRITLILELYSAFIDAAEEKELPRTDTLHTILYDYVYDYYMDQTEKKLKNQLIPGDNKWAGTKLEYGNSDAILYLTGEYVGDNEIRMFEFLNRIPEDELSRMADTFTDGYIKGFEVTGRDLSIKNTAELRFNIGFIPMMKKAASNLKKAGLDVSMMRAGYSIFTGRSVDKNGFFGGNPNPQFDYDHKDDIALILDEKLNERRIDCLSTNFEKFKHEARVYAGPAVVDIFGEEDYEPVEKEEAASHNADTRRLITEYASSAGRITNEYIPGEERSFTIIAFPVPSIGELFEDILRDTIKINTLDYVLYRDIQQNIIDALDQAKYVKIKGMNGNKTDLKVWLHELIEPEKQTNFENCVADVNIPVGEVFTSPILAGTTGILNVSRVFLNGLEYQNLTIDIEDGMIRGYDCDNFRQSNTEEERAKGKKMIEDNILFHHDTLPMGEFAIGTNTTAYEVARRYGIEAKLPILIAEKTGPHFAFGDTCYSHSEDLKVYNPDGKEIIARDNECSLKRLSNPSEAYFNCHTDITIPYDELDEVTAVTAEGTEICIIYEGRFVLAECEKLNEPLDK